MLYIACQRVACLRYRKKYPTTACLCNSKYFVANHVIADRLKVPTSAIQILFESHDHTYAETEAEEMVPLTEQPEFRDLTQHR